MSYNLDVESAPRAIRWQFLAASLVSAGLLVSILVWDQARLAREIFYRQAAEAAHLNSRAVQTLAADALAARDARRLRGELRRMVTASSLAYVDVFDRMGRPVLSYTNTALRSDGLPSSRWAARDDVYEVDIPLASGLHQVGSLRVGADVSDLKRAVDGFILRGLLLGLGLLAVVAGIAWWFGHLLGARLQTLTESIRQLPGGAGLIPVGGNDEVGFLARTFNDMSRSLEAERQERRKVEKFKEDLIHMLVHDLKNPLTTLSLLSWSLAREPAGAPPDKKNLELLERNVLQLEELVRGILDVAKMQTMRAALRRREVRPESLVEDAVRDYQLQAGSRGLRLSGSCGKGLPALSADPDTLRRVLGNLVSNALSHTPPGGGVRVSAQAAPGNALFSVADDGEGISEEDKKRIFEKFVQGTRPTAKGSGLGLAFCRMAVEQHGGRIWVDSQVGRGSTFYFTIPTEAAPAPALAAPGKAPAAADGEESRTS